MDPEIITPAAKRPGMTDEQLDRLAGLLDDMFHIPGTTIRFGLDPVVGLVPGLGDLLTGLLAFLIVFAAWQRRLPRVTMLRMVANIAIDTLVGTIPLFGDMFDVVWKSNRMNYNLLLRYRGGIQTRHVLRDWLFFVLLLLCAATLIVLPIAIVVGLFYLLRGRP